MPRKFPITLAEPAFRAYNRNMGDWHEIQARQAKAGSQLYALVRSLWLPRHAGRLA